MHGPMQLFGEVLGSPREALGGADGPSAAEYIASCDLGGQSCPDLAPHGVPKGSSAVNVMSETQCGLFTRGNKCARILETTQGCGERIPAYASIWVYAILHALIFAYT